MSHQRNVLFCNIHLWGFILQSQHMSQRLNSIGAINIAVSIKITDFYKCNIYFCDISTFLFTITML